jgi:PAS domain S-box-containing protein
MSDIVNEVNEQSPAVLERRRRPRRELDARQSHLAGILTQLPDAILSLDRNWIITFANAEAFRISRLQPDEINTRSHWELFPETIGTEVEHAYRAVMETRVARKIEYFYAPFAVWLEISVSPIEDGIALHYRDITDRKYAEVLRDDAVNRLREIFDAAPESIVCINRSWKCTFANRAALDMLKTDSLLGEDLWERFPSNRQEPFRSNYLATMERRTPTSFEAYYPQPLDIWFKVACRPFEDGIIIFASDITDRKGAELLRDASARQLSQVLETTSDAVVTLNRDWNFTFLNRRAKELLSPKGSHRTDLLGKNLWQEFDFAAHSHEFPLYCHRAMNDGSFGSFELFYPKPLYLWLAFQCHPFTDGVVLYFRDVTEERAAKQVLLDQQETLSFVQQTARVANWEIELATGAMTFGQGSYPVFGRPCSEITTVQKFRSLVVPEHLEIILREVPRAIETGELLSLDYQVTGPDGPADWMTTDITVRKQNEEALAASEARYRVLADLNPQAIWMGAPDGSITYANQGFLDFIGLSLEDLLGHGLAQRLLLRMIANMSSRSGTTPSPPARSTRSKPVSSARATGRSAGGGSAPGPSATSSEIILHWLGVAMDIHDRKTAADEPSSAEQERPNASAPSSRPSTDRTHRPRPLRSRRVPLPPPQRAPGRDRRPPPEQVLGRTSPKSLPSKACARCSSRSPPVTPFAIASSKANSPPVPKSIASGTSTTSPSTTPTAPSGHHRRLP